MKRIKLLMLAGIIIIIGMQSCKTGLTEDQKLFLDYAKLEDRYHGTNFYLNLDVHSDTISAPEYLDEKFSMSEFRERLKRSFKLVTYNNVISPDYEGANIQYPHQYVLRRQADSSYQVDLAVFVPDHFSMISLTKKDIGKIIEKEDASFVLLDITSDAATIMVTDKAKRNDYDYTYDVFERKNNTKDKKERTINADPSYEAGLFLGESIDEPNATDDFVEDSLVRVNFSRANITLQDEEGKTLSSQGRINNFRHYLWYRNNDMPYEEMKSDYRTLQYQYKEQDKDSMHQFHPIEIVNIKGRGKIGSVEILIRSNKGKVERINLGKHVPQVQESSKSETVSYSPVPAMDSAVINKLLKINFSIINDHENRPSSYLLYASLPNTYRRGGLDLEFDEVWMKNATDSLSLEMEDASIYFEIGTSRIGNNLTAVKISKPQMDVQSIKGELLINISGIADTSFAITALPAGVKMFNDGKSFTILLDEIPVQDVKDFFGLQTGKKHKALVYEYDRAEPEVENSITIHFKEAPEKLIFRYKKDEGYEYAKSFELQVVKPVKK